MFNTADYTTYLTDEAHLHNAADESIALTPKTPKRDETTKLESVQISNDSPVGGAIVKTTTSTTTSPIVEIHQQQSPSTPVTTITTSGSEKKRQQQLQQQQQQQQQQQTTPGGVGSVGNMSMAESMDGSFYNGYDSSKHPIETDNIPVEARPKSAG